MKQSGEYVTHCAQVRLRINGTGNIRPAVFDLGNTNFDYLTTLAMNQNVTGRTLTTLANLKSEMIQVEIRTIAKDEIFTVSRIIPYVKPTAANYPLI